MPSTDALKSIWAVCLRIIFGHFDIAYEDAAHSSRVFVLFLLMLLKHDRQHVFRVNDEARAEQPTCGMNLHTAGKGVL